MTRRWPAPAALAAGALAALALAAGPAAAAPDGTFTSPAEGARVDHVPTIAGTVRLSGRVDSLTLSVFRAGGGEALSTITTGCADPAPGFRCEDSGRRVTFSWTPPLAVNGTFAVEGSALHRGDGVVGAEDSAALPARRFAVEAPPRTPRDLTATLDRSSRVVALTWARNPESDIIGYRLYRSRSGTGDLRPVDVPQSSSSPVRYADTEAASGPGGEHVYRVVALRSGATSSSTVASTPSAPVYASVPPPPSTTTTTTAPAGSGDATGPGSSGGTTTTTSRPSPTGISTRPAPTSVTRSGGGAVDLSDFGAIESAAQRPGPTAPPDPGFSTALPYGPTTTTSTPPPTVVQAAPTGPALVGEGGDDDRRRLLSFLAAAMAAFVLSMHLRWLLRRLPDA